MAGIYGLYTELTVFEKPIFNKFYSSKFQYNLNEEFRYENFVYGRSVLPKFLDDRFLMETNDLIAGFEGVCYNFNNGGLKKELSLLYKKKGVRFIEELKGQFSGFVFDKRKNVISVFTDTLSTKPLYVYFDSFRKIFFFSSELKAISQSLRKAKVDISLNSDAVRYLLTFGYMIGDVTPVSEIKKVNAGNILELDLKNFKLSERQYHSFKKEVLPITKREAAQAIEELLLKAIEREWNKDTQYGYQHLSFLSGGLDSRVNTLLGSKKGTFKVSSLTFSEPSTPDQRIAKKIADDYGFEHHFVSLENGTYLLENIYEYIKANDGVVTLIGAAHLQYALSSLDLQPYGLAHSGQIGDVLFGSFFSSQNDILSNLNKLAYNPSISTLQKTNNWEKTVSEIMATDSEIFSLYHRQVNGTMNGDRCSSHLIDSASPFYDKDLITLCLTFPDKLKKGKFIYQAWMEEYHHYLCKYKWASDLAYPRNSLLYRSLGFSNRFWHFLLRKVGIDQLNMNPFQKWHQINPQFIAFDSYVDNEELLSEFDSLLRADIIKCLKSKNFKTKMGGISALLSYKLHFLD